MLAETSLQARRFLDRWLAGLILIGGLKTQARHRVKLAKAWSPIHLFVQRASAPYKHRDQGRRIFGTSRDVMPAMAGYTSYHPVSTTIVETRGCYEDMV